MRLVTVFFSLDDILFLQADYWTINLRYSLQNSNVNENIERSYSLHHWNPRDLKTEWSTNYDWSLSVSTPQNYCTLSNEETIPVIACPFLRVQKPASQPIPLWNLSRISGIARQDSHYARGKLAVKKDFPCEVTMCTSHLYLSTTTRLHIRLFKIWSSRTSYKLMLILSSW